MSSSAVASTAANIATLHQIVAAFNGNDTAALERLVSPDLVYTMEGRSTLAGRYDGHAGMRAFVDRIHGSCDDGLSVTPVTMTADGRWVIMLAQVAARRLRRELAGLSIYVYEFADGTLQTARNVPCDQYAWDEFWAA